MSDHYCYTCDKTIKLRCKKKHLNDRLHKSLSYSIINRYCVKNHEFLQIENGLKKYAWDYYKKFAFFIFMCKWKLDIDNIIFCVESDRLYNIHGFWDIRGFLFAKINSFEKIGYKFSNISQMNIPLITNLRNMTYEHYINQPKPMVEWTLMKKLAKDPSLIKNLENTSPPLIKKYINMFPVEGENQNLL